MNISGKELLSLIPQSYPMVMIDTLLSSDDKKTKTSLTVSENNIFCLNGKFAEAGIIENMAQTAAARAGYEAKIKKEKVRTGFIGAIKNLKIHFLPDTKSVLQTEITIEYNLGDVSLISGNVFIDQKIVAECEMKIFLI